MFAFSTAAWHKSKMSRHSPWHCIVAWLFKIFPFSFFSKKFMTQLLKLLWLKFTNFISVYWTLFISCFTTFSAECWNYMHQRGTDTKFLCFEHAWGKYGTPSPFGMDVKTRQKCCFSYPPAKFVTAHTPGQFLPQHAPRVGPDQLRQQRGLRLWRRLQRIKSS